MQPRRALELRRRVPWANCSENVLVSRRARSMRMPATSFSCGGQVEPGDGVGLVLGLGQARGARVRRALRERVDGGALGVALPAPQRVGMDRDEQRGLARAGELDAIAQRHEGVVGPGHEHAVFAGLLDLVAQHQRELEDDGLLHLPARRPGPVVDAAMAGIDHHERARIAVRPGVRGRLRLALQRAGPRPRSARRNASRSLAARSTTRRAG